jgi:hypothetical protein
MDYFDEAFGGFRPQIDPDAAVKFALNSLLMDERLSELSCLLTDGHEIGAVEGEPGWIIERRDSGPAGNIDAYAHWSQNAHFYAHVDAEAFQLAHPGFFTVRR